jgi:hypothetical protein
MLAPDMIEPLVGWRAWRVSEGDGGTHLSSVIHRATWPAGAPLVARCQCTGLRIWPFKRERHDAPALDCGCGIYAANIAIVRAYLPEQVNAMDSILVIGQVSLWGTVHEHERGWRAAFAYPKRLFVPTTALKPERAAGLIGHLGLYGIPVEGVRGSSADDLIAGATGAVRACG